jgi:hypothetical protein
MSCHDKLLEQQQQLTPYIFPIAMNDIHTFYFLDTIVGNFEITAKYMTSHRNGLMN